MNITTELGFHTEDVFNRTQEKDKVLKRSEQIPGITNYESGKCQRKVRS